MGNLCVCSDALLSQGEQDVGVAYDIRRNNEMDHFPAHGVLKVVELLYRFGGETVLGVNAVDGLKYDRLVEKNGMHTLCASGTSRYLSN